MMAAGTPATTMALRRYYVTRLARSRPQLLALTTEDLAVWLGEGEWSPNTRKSARAALRAFYGWAVDAGHLEASPAHRLPPVRTPRAKARPTPERAYRAALDVADPRSRLVLELAARVGLRRGEIARVRVEDVEADLVGHSLRVKGKGGHVRIVPLPEDLAEQLLAHRAGWVFPSPRGGHITPNHLARVVRPYLGHGIHSLRHRCGTVAYAATRDLRAVQELLGHARPETTAGYVQVPDDAVRAAMRAAAA
jgi:integrase